MNKKTVFLIALTALVSGLLYALPTFASAPFQGERPPAQAAPPQGARHPRKGMRPRSGEITALDAASITLKTLAGQDITLPVDENTLYASPGGFLTFDDLQVGDTVVIEAVRKDSAPVATLVIQVPPDSDPSELRRNTFRGEVWSLGNGIITLQTRRGEQVMLFVDENTAFQSPSGLVQGFSDLQVHMQIGVFAAPQADGTLHANVVLAARPRISKHIGTVSSADETSLTLSRRDGQTVTFQINAETRFQGEADSAAALQAGMQARVAAYQNASGQWTAVVIGVRAAPPQDAP